MEHVERQEERERAIKGDIDQLEHQGDELDQRGEQVQEDIDQTREEFRRKQESDDVPGAQPEGGHPQGTEPPPEADITPGDDED